MKNVIKDFSQSAARGWQVKIFTSAVHTEYAGAGRVRAFSFFGGAGYCLYLMRGSGLDGKPLTAWHWPTIALRGFTCYIRVAATSSYSTWGESFRRVLVTANPNRYNLFKYTRANPQGEKSNG